MGNVFSDVCDLQLVLPFLCGKGENLHNLEDNVEALQNEMQEVNAMMNHLLRKVSKEGGRLAQEVSMWISMVEETEPEANRLLDGSISVIQRLSMYGYFSRFSASACRYSENITLTLEKVRNLRCKGAFESATLAQVKKVHQPTVSQGKLLERTWNRLMDKNVGTLGVYGTAGVGKSTLLKQINNKWSDDIFDLVIFVGVESEHVGDVQNEIGSRLGLRWGRETKDVEKAAEIFAVLKGKRFLLLLNGIEKQVKFEKIGVPTPSRENGCKIVFETRNRGVSNLADAEVQVRPLSSDEAWVLFQNIVGETTLTSHPDIPKLARIVADRCSGLPLTLKVVGRSMASKRTVQEWRNAIHVLVSSHLDLSGLEETTFTIFTILKFTYDNLPGVTIKWCFLYCALFPQYGDIRRQDLVDYWVKEGMVSDEITGYEVISDLVGACLLEDVSGYCVKMPIIVRAMALWITSDYRRQNELVVVKGGERIKEMPKVDDWRRVTRMSVSSTQIENISDSPNCSQLRTLFLQGNNNLRSISGCFFRAMTNLVVLNMSHNRELSVLPEEVSSLVSLQLLNLSWTSIEWLPTGLKNLLGLVHLDLEHTHELKGLQDEVVVGLLNLKTVRLLESFPMDHLTIELLQCSERLEELSLTVTRGSVLAHLLSNQRLASCTRRLSISGIAITKGAATLLRALCSLHELDIRSCSIQDSPMDWRRSNIDEIPRFRHLRRVSFDGCGDLRDLTWLLNAPCLGDLSLNECLDTKEIISKEKAMDQQLDHNRREQHPFQNLTSLSLTGLPQLESIYWNPLPFSVLRIVIISRCPSLKRLPFNSDNTKGNQIEVCLEEEWIKGVEWEDEITKQHFTTLNKSYPKLFFSDCGS